MSSPTLNLVVLRCRDSEASVSFYQRLGLTFIRHRHGKGPEHYSADLNGTVFELYPLVSEDTSTRGTRIGFRVTSVDSTLSALDDPSAIHSPAQSSEWGRRAVIIDPDGHRIELTEP